MSEDCMLHAKGILSSLRCPSLLPYLKPSAALAVQACLASQALEELWDNAWLSTRQELAQIVHAWSTWLKVYLGLDVRACS